MILGKYKLNKENTAEEQENDDIHGYSEIESRELTFTAPKYFKYSYYYSQLQVDTDYVIEDDINNDTSFSGTYVVDGSKVVTTIVSGKQVARDLIKEQDLGSKENITGTITFDEVEGKLKVLSFELQPKELHRIQQMVFKNASFNKCQ